MKLDMKKAYDRVDWLFLTKVLRKVGFGECMIDMIFRLVGNNWYSILLNGQPKGFFKSSRGLKQGDPLSPTLFIIAAEVLSRALKSLMATKEFKLFGMPIGSPKVNHFAFADDMIILCKADLQTMQLVTGTLENMKKCQVRRLIRRKVPCTFIEVYLMEL